LTIVSLNDPIGSTLGELEFSRDVSLPDARAAASPTRAILRVIGIILSVAAGLWALHRLERVVLVVILAGALAYVIVPLVGIAERPVRLAGRARRLRRGPAIALVYLLLIGILCATVSFLMPRVADQIDDMTARAPAYTQAILTWEHGWSRYYARLRIPLGLRQNIDASLDAFAIGAAAYARTVLLEAIGTLTYVPWLVLVPVLGFFLLKDAANLRRMFVKALPQGNRLRSHRLFEELNATLAAYMRAQLLACVLVGTICGLGFAILGLPYSAVLGVVAGVLEFIPLVGPLVVAAIAALVGALHSPVLALWAIGFLVVLRVAEDYVIYPRLLGRSIHLHPLAVILAVLAGTELGGIAGMFLALPVVAICSVAFRHWVDWDEDAAAALTSTLTSS
jgi:predicted PurR-regulated permease PerM